SDVVMRWTGADTDGDIVNYEWTYDDTLTEVTTADTLLIEDVTEGDHVFTIAAVDDDGDTGEVATCTFSVGPRIVNRNILVEFLTDFACTNCPNGEEALENLMDEYGRDRLCVVAYHSSALGTDETVARQIWYQEALEFPNPIGHPCAIFDGLRLIIGAPSVPEAEAEYEFEIELRQPVGSPLSMELSGDLSAGVSLTVRVLVHDVLAAGTYVLRTVVMEEDVNFAHHLFPFVARDVLDDQSFTLTEVGDLTEIVYDVVLDPAWNAANLDAIAFVQNDDTLEVIQSVRLSASRRP
ncbi:hypothetical protein K8S17_03445, partial [bacterium]|nr:hypothetical protein [bacterium]